MESFTIWLQKNLSGVVGAMALAPSQFLIFTGWSTGDTFFIIAGGITTSISLVLCAEWLTTVWADHNSVQTPSLPTTGTTKKAGFPLKLREMKFREKNLPPLKDVRERPLDRL